MEAAVAEQRTTKVRAHIREGRLVAAHERALGIPDRSVSTDPEVGQPEVWEFVVQDHHAHRAGRHFDLRLGDPKSGVAYSWAIPKARLPSPGEKLLAVKQPDHTLGYMDYQGTIESGYGAGDVLQHVRSKTEVLAANQDYVKFNLYTSTPGHKVSEFLLRRLEDGNWLLMNVTPQPKPWIPEGKASYKKIPPHDLRLDIDDEVFQAKIDGAHVLVVMEPGKQIRVLSHRRSRRGGGLIDHTHKVSGLLGKKHPKGAPRTVVRAELWAKDSSGKAIPTPKLSGVLNSSVWRARKTLEREKWSLRISPFDVESIGPAQGADIPWVEKRRALHALAGAHKQVELPPTAITPEGKRSLLDLVKAGKLPETREGVVVHSMSGGTPKKSKFKDDFDVYVRSIFPAISARGRDLGRAGGFEWSDTPDGPILGRVGTGMDHALLKRMAKNPEEFIGRAARVTAQERLPSGALRAPAFEGWHLDK